MSKNRGTATVWITVKYEADEDVDVAALLDRYVEESGHGFRGVGRDGFYSLEPLEGKKFRGWEYPE